MRAASTCFEIIEVHAAQGFLLHQFYFPIANNRRDDYGVSFESARRMDARRARAHLSFHGLGRWGDRLRGAAWTPSVVPVVG